MYRGNYTYFFNGRRKMMKKVLVLMLVLGIASGANAALSITTQDSGAFEIVKDTTATFNIANSEGTNYTTWIELVGDAASYSGDPTFTAAGNPNGDSVVNYYPDYAGWYEINVTSFNPDNPIVAGDQIAVALLGQTVGTVTLNVYASDGATLLATQDIQVIPVPEPLTIALMGLGGLFLRRRK